MIKLLQTQIKELHITLEITFSELEKVRTALSFAELDLKGKSDEEKEAINYLTSEFYPFIVNLTDTLKGTK